MITKVLQTSCVKLLHQNSFAFLEPIKVYAASSLIHTTSIANRKLDESFRHQIDRIGNRQEIEKLGLAKYVKKHRQYAQFSYQDYKVPEGKQGISIACTRGLLHENFDEPIGTFKDRTREKLTRSLREMQSNRAIKKRVPNFHKKRFPIEAHAIYVEAHNLLNTKHWTISNKRDTEERLHDLVTEHAYGDMVKGLEQKTIVWKFIESIEAPQVIKVGHVPMLEEDNLYAQITVRFHTKQTLAVYDRFGRLVHGSPDSPRNVLENVCFERHLYDEYGMWRIHAKLPTDTYPREPMRRTVAAIKSSPQRVDADEWEKARQEQHWQKYSPEREWAMELEAEEKLINKNYKYYAIQRKHRVLKKMKFGLRRMRGKARTMTNRKLTVIQEMRKEGKLPLPPKDNHID